MREGIVELRADLGLVVAGESPVANVADHADNGEGAVIHVGHPEKFAEGVLSGEGALGEHVVDDDDELAARAILIVEKAAATERKAHYI